MANTTDYLMDDNFDLMIKNGDFAKGDATLKHQKMLLLSQKGNYKQSPTIGVASRDFINDDADADDYQAAIQEEFENDGMRINKIILNSFTDIEIEASYE